MILRKYYIFIVGCPASGKSTLASAIVKKFPFFNYSTDFFALIELFKIDDIFRDLVLNKGKISHNDFQLIENELHSITYWNDLVSSRIKLFKSGILELNSIGTIKTNDGGHDIIKPQIWDEILLRTLKHIISSDYVIFEFSRGLDHKYIKYFNISNSEIYEHSFNIIKGNIPNLNYENSTILHVFTTKRNRLERNYLRMLNGEHFVSDKVMNTVYKVDYFKYNKAKFGHNYLSKNNPFSVVLVDNSIADFDKNFSAIIEKLSILFK